ncbi:MAG: hypothetical protein ACFCUJ_02350 [Thiotrichales bacterium]
MANTHDQTADSALNNLEGHLGELLELVEQSRKENARLRHENAHLVAERSQLLSNRDKVRTQVESMINRLKTMEHSG